MGWNRQSGENWVLQRTMRTEGDNWAKMLTLKVNGLLTIEDAQTLCGALAAEIQAAAKSEGTRLFIREQLGVELQPWQERIMDRQISYGSSVLQHWDDVLGVYDDREPPTSDAVGRLLCRKCGGVITDDQYRFGSPQTRWEHMAGECQPPANLEDDDGCPND